MNMEPPNMDFAAWLGTVNRQMPTNFQADDARAKWAYASLSAIASETERREGNQQLTNVRVTFCQSARSRSKEYRRTEDDAVNAGRDIRLFLENEVFPTDTIGEREPD
jgi:hypothetical protein